ncbi:MAG: S1 RNA-binding domain-containing protein [Bacillota bacterium]|jgi:predicted RNA-binding protein with RPS1 domain|nr:S1 RNA-binding domain-containing protein [Bacillota bacterium]NLL26612.1 S1 RNA-binding domain-containing protein [Erysipelotrichia bacterium]
MYKIGQVVQGMITAIKPYGAFVKVDERTSGLIHISEISEYYINDVAYFFKKGEKVIVKIIDINKYGQLRLSLKAIQTNRKYAVPTKKDIAKIEKIGFKSLKEKLPVWIEDALKEKV